MTLCWMIAHIPVETDLYLRHAYKAGLRLVGLAQVSILPAFTWQLVYSNTSINTAAHHFIECLLHEVELQVNLGSILHGLCPKGLCTATTLVRVQCAEANLARVRCCNLLKTQHNPYSSSRQHGICSVLLAQPSAGTVSLGEHAFRNAGG